MSELIINEATCARCGHTPAACTCRRTTVNVIDRTKILPLPTIDFGGDEERGEKPLDTGWSYPML